VRELVKMVQHALDATKSFIFDVRPMVLDDLGLVPTLRRVGTRPWRARGCADPTSSRSRRSPSRRDVESGLFRILDDALVGYLTTHPPEVHIEIDWNNDKVRALVRSDMADDPRSPRPVPTHGVRTDAGAGVASASRDEKPPRSRRTRRDDPRAAGRHAAVARRPPTRSPRRGRCRRTQWRDIEHRAGTLRVDVALAAQGRALQVVVTIGAAGGIVIGGPCGGPA
jgi:hypothetical protein